jgi:hypothetical protein
VSLHIFLNRQRRRRVKVEHFRPGFGLSGQVDADAGGNALGKLFIDIAQVGDHARRDLFEHDLRKLERE